MKVEIRLNEKLEEPILTIETPAITEDIKKITEYINSIKANVLVGQYMEKIEVIDESQIIRIFAQDKKVYALVENKKYTLYKSS